MKLTTYVLLLLAMFVASRGIFYSFGVSFDPSPLYTFVQYIDVGLLQSRLFESIYYLHSQPPLFNLFLGILIKLFPADYILAAHIIYLIIGQIFMVGMFLLMVQLGVKPWLACVCTTIFMVSPGVMYYENLLFYEYPAAMLMTWSAYWLHVFARKRQGWHGLMFFVSLALLGLLKSVFHLLWMLALGVIIWRLLRIPIKKMLVMAIVPFLVLFSVYLKNYLIFGDFTLSFVVLSENLLNMSANILPKAKVYEHYRQGKISPLTAITILDEGEYIEKEEMGQIAAEESRKTQKTGIPILDRVFVGSPRKRSLHSMESYANYREYIKDSLFMMREDIRSYQLSLERTLFLYFFPGPTDFTVHNREHLGKYENNFNFPFKHLNQLNHGKLYTDYLLQWFRMYELRWDNWAMICLSLTITFYVSLFYYGIHRVVQLLKASHVHLQDVVVLGFMVMNIAYVSLLSILISWWGTNRYRFNIESFYWVFFALLLTQILQRLRSRFRPLDRA